MLIDWEQAPATHSMRAGASRRVVSGLHTTVVRVETAPTARFDGVPHRHLNEQWVVVVGGRLRLTCGDEEFDLRCGDVVHVPAGSWHAAVGVGAEGARYLEFSTPPRPDLLPGSLAPSPLEYASPAAAG
jgi:quercetin dioxygenase-like cupin family protein